MCHDLGNIKVCLVSTRTVEDALCPALTPCRGWTTFAAWRLPQVAGVQYILDSVVQSLLQDQNRKFVFAEMVRPPWARLPDITALHSAARPTAIFALCAENLLTLLPQKRFRSPSQS
jgi:hypothetical protein